MGNTKVVVKAVEKPEEPTIASDIESAAAVGAKTVKVVFNGDLATTSGVAISVKKGSTELTKDSVAFNDSKTATVTLKTGLTAGTYTAVATGVVSGTSLSKDFSVESEEYVATIELSSKKAPMVGTTDPSNKDASVSYVMKNQYGEVVTNSAAPNFIASTGVPAVATYKNGVGTVTISKPTAFIPAESVYVNAVLTNGTHVATLSDSVEIVLPASFDKAEIAGVYNKTLKKMDSITSAKLKDGSYVYQLLFTAYDQYGNVMDADKLAAATPDFTILSTNPIFINPDISTITTTEVDGKTYVAVTLKAGDMAEKGGTATVQIISTKTGTKSAFDVVADAAGAVVKFALSTPAEYAVVGEKLEIPFEAYDQNGTTVKDFKALDGNITLSMSSGNGMKFVQKADSTAKLVADLSSISISGGAKSVPVYLSAVVKSNGNFSSATINVQEKAIPTSILGLKDNSKIATTVLSGVDQDIDYTKLSIGDQYGRVMKDADVKTYMDANSMVIYCTSDKTNALFEVVSDNATDLTNVNNASPAVTNDNDADCGLNYAASTNKFTVKAKQDSKKDIEKLTFGLGTLNTTALTTNAASEKSITFTTSAAKEFVSYAVDDLATLHYVSDTAAASSVIVDAKDVVEPSVYGVKADGTKVKLDKTYYSITTNAKSDALDTDNGVIKQKDNTSTKYANADFQVSANDTTHKNIELKATFTIKDKDHGSDATTIEKKLVLDNSKAKVVTGKFNSKVSDGTVYVAAATLKGYASVKTDLVDTLLDTNEIKDQYGIKNNERTAPEAYTISISNVKDATSTAFTYNATGDTVTVATTGDTFTINIKYAEGFTLTVNVVVE